MINQGHKYPHKKAYSPGYDTTADERSPTAPLRHGTASTYDDSDQTPRRSTSRTISRYSSYSSATADERGITDDESDYPQPGSHKRRRTTDPFGTDFDFMSETDGYGDRDKPLTLDQAMNSKAPTPTPYAQGDGLPEESQRIQLELYSYSSQAPQVSQNLNS